MNCFKQVTCQPAPPVKQPPYLDETLAYPRKSLKTQVFSKSPFKKLPTGKMLLLVAKIWWRWWQGNPLLKERDTEQTSENGKACLQNCLENQNHD